MKHFFYLFIFIFLFINSGFSQKQTLFLDKNYDEVLAKAKTENKPIVFMFYATWCTHCNKMKKDVFTQQNVIDFYATNYECIAVNAEAEDGNKMKAKFDNQFKVKGYPTFAYLDSNENLMQVMSGEFTADNFISEGKQMLVPENRLPYLKAKFNEDVSNGANCLKYIQLIRKANDDATDITRRYLSTVKSENRFTPENWKIMAYGINDFDADEFKFIYQNRDQFAKTVSTDRIDKKIIAVFKDKFMGYLKTSDTLNFNKREPIARSFNIRKVDSLLFNYKLYIDQNIANWTDYSKTAQENVEKFAWKDSKTLTDICLNFQLLVSDEKALQDAVKWNNHSIEISPTLDKYLIGTRLLKKLGNKKEALAFALNSKGIAQAFGWKTDEFDTLIDDLKKK